MSASKALIVGAGPVGLTLAIDLGKRGEQRTLVEQKDAPFWNLGRSKMRKKFEAEGSA